MTQPESSKSNVELPGLPGLESPDAALPLELVESLRLKVVFKIESCFKNVFSPRFCFFLSLRLKVRRRACALTIAGLLQVGHLIIFVESDVLRTIYKEIYAKLINK